MGSRILVFGAGVIGSIFAGALYKAGNDITLLARGERYNELKEKGLMLKDVKTGNLEVFKIKCINTLCASDEYDFIIVAVQNKQVDSVLPVLADNVSKNIVFVVNNPSGYEKYISAIGKERVLAGFPSAGGEKKDGVVTYFIGRGIARVMQTTTFGEVDGQITERLKRLVSLFREAGFAVTYSKNMDAWQKTHIAFVVPIAYALCRFNSNNYLLAKSGKTIKTMILAMREGFQAVKKNGNPVEPRKLLYHYLPLFLLVPYYKTVFSMKIAEYALAKHTITAKGEIDDLNAEFLSMYGKENLASWNELCD